MRTRTTKVKFAAMGLVVLMAALVTVASPILPSPDAVAVTPDGPVITKVGAYAVAYDADSHGLAEAAHGTATTVTVDYSRAPAGSYTLRWGCGLGSLDHQAVSQIPDDTTNGIVVYPIDTSEPSTFCTFGVGDSVSSPYYVTLLQLDPLTISRFTNPSGPALYPRIHPDAWTARFETNSPATVTLSVRNSDGRQVYSHKSSTWRLDDGNISRDWAASVAWNGRRTNGTLVPLGTYHVRIGVASTHGSGARTLGPFKAVVKPGRRPVTKRVHRSGALAQRSTGGGCFAAPQSIGTLWLNCSVSDRASGTYASGTWSFKVPRSAKVVRWRITGAPAGDDVASDGTISRTLSRPRRTVIRIKLRVTGRRSYFADTVYLTYTYLK